MKSIKNIAFAGTGNVAFHLAKNLKMNGYNISGVLLPARFIRRHSKRLRDYALMLT
jgi:3-hydroxyisobutyrate dehydrogenase-like beta-hydroxyacid dehydrogenase